MFFLEDFREIRSIWRILENFKIIRLHSDFGMLKILSQNRFSIFYSAQFHLRAFFVVKWIVLAAFLSFCVKLIGSLLSSF